MLAPEPGVLFDEQVVFDSDLAGEPEPGIGIVRWSRQPKPFSRSGIAHLAGHRNSTGSARPQPATVESVCPAVMGGLVRSAEHVPEHCASFTLEFPTADGNSWHARSWHARYKTALPYQLKDTPRADPCIAPSTWWQAIPKYRARTYCRTCWKSRADYPASPRRPFSRFAAVPVAQLLDQALRRETLLELSLAGVTDQFSPELDRANDRAAIARKGTPLSVYAAWHASTFENGDPREH